MNIFILNEEFQKVALVQAFESFFWVERYNSIGEFELYLPADSITNLKNILRNDYYIQIPISKNLMIIENIRTNFEIERGYYIIVSGKTLESILERRVIYPLSIYPLQPVQSVMQKLITEFFITPKSSVHNYRKINNFIFTSTNNPNIAQMQIERQYFGEDVSTAITKMCKECSIGWRINLTSDNKFEFMLYDGIDRSFEEPTNKTVVFSPSYNNVINSEYLDSIANYANSFVVAGEERENNTRFLTSIHHATETGLKCREVFFDMSNVRSKTINANDEEIDMSESEYLALLNAKGAEELKEFKHDKHLTAQVVDNHYVYGVDYYLGDIVQIEDDLGNSSRARITEVIVSIDVQGVRIYPEFELIEEGE